MSFNNIQKASIVSTIGPATDTPEKIEKLIKAGVSIIRINLSHGTQETAKKRYEMVRDVDDSVAILFDLSGPKIRIGEMKKPEILVPNQKFIITSRKVKGNCEQVSVNYPELIKLTKPGHYLYMNDGLIRVRVVETTDTDIITEVIRGGTLSSRKGVNTPGIPINLYSPTKKDISDIEFTAGLEPDFYGVSFVRRGKDLNLVRQHIQTQTKNVPHLISKIEHQDAIKNFSDILKLSNGIMVARGDLGVEMDPAEVPLVQKSLIRKCNKKGVPVIVATQMLESMVVSANPTRAEASDVANAIIDGADAVMLSAETATGNFPVESVKMMHRIIMNAQTTVKPLKQSYEMGISPLWDAVGRAAVTLANSIEASAILANTRSGDTSRVISKYRPNQPIIALTPNKHTYRRLNLQWGVIPVYLDHEFNNTDNLIATSVKTAFDMNLIDREEIIVVVAGSLLGYPYSTNLIQYHNVTDLLKASKLNK